MRLVAVVFIYSGAFLCCLPACSSVVTCNITSNRSVYAFPSHFLNDLDSTSSAYFINVEVSIHLDEEVRNCRKDRLNYMDSYFEQKITNLVHSVSENGTEPEKNSFHLKFPVNPQKIWAGAKAKIGVAHILFRSYFKGNCKDKTDTSRWCYFEVIFVQDNPPSVVFKTALNAWPNKWINGTSDLNGTSSHVVEVSSLDNKVEVQIAVSDSDYFVDNPDKFEYCAVSEPNITLSAVVTFYGYSQKSNISTPHNLTLATDLDLGSSEKAWWTRNSSRINDSFIHVRFDFAVSALCSAISGLLTSSDLSYECISDTFVNLTLDVTAKSGCANPLENKKTFFVRLRLANGTTCVEPSLSQSTYTATTTKNEEHSTATTTKNEDNSPKIFYLVAVVCGVTLSVILLLIVIMLSIKFRDSILRQYVTCQTVVGRKWRRVCSRHRQ